MSNDKTADGMPLQTLLNIYGKVFHQDTMMLSTLARATEHPKGLEAGIREHIGRRFARRVGLAKSRGDSIDYLMTSLVRTARGFMGPSDQAALRAYVEGLWQGADRR